jgi:hypothetical protein
LMSFSLSTSSVPSKALDVYSPSSFRPLEAQFIFQFLLTFAGLYLAFDCLNLHMHP